jgi:hypothetical protein
LIYRTDNNSDVVLRMDGSVQSMAQEFGAISGLLACPRTWQQGTVYAVLSSGTHGRRSVHDMARQGEMLPRQRGRTVRKGASKGARNTLPALPDCVTPPGLGLGATMPGVTMLVAPVIENDGNF